METLRSRVLARELMVGTFSGLDSPIAVEIIGGAGFDFLCLDAEHSPLDRRCLEELIRAADVSGTPAIVRVPGNGSEAIASALDSGAKGILVPRVNTPEEAAAAVSSFRYPPQGKRGAGPGRSTIYGARLMQYVATANESLLLAVQVESAEAIENIESIVKVDGIDLIFVGPGDLSISLGLIGPDDQAKLIEVIEQIVSVCQKAGKAVGLFRLSPVDVLRWVAAGVTFFIIGSDGMFLASGAISTAAAARQVATNSVQSE